MRKILFFFFIFTLCLVYLSQKTSITILAYQLYQKKVVLENLLEERENLAYNLRKNINVPQLLAKLEQSNFRLHYSREYVKLVPVKAAQGIYGEEEISFARVLGFASRVEAQP